MSDVIRIQDNVLHDWVDNLSWNFILWHGEPNDCKHHPEQLFKVSDFFGDALLSNHNLELLYAFADQELPVDF